MILILTYHKVVPGSESHSDFYTVTAEKLAAARNGIQTQTGASTYTITSREIQAQPGGQQHVQSAIGSYIAQADRGSTAQVHVNQPRESK